MKAGSKSYASTNYLKTIFSRPGRPNRSVQVEELETPFCFRQKSMSEEEKNSALQMKIVQQPHLYVKTHVKCQVCKKFIEIELVNHHSLIHFNEEQRLEKILCTKNSLFN